MTITPPKTGFTKAFIDKASCSPDKPFEEVSDPALPCLFIRVSKTGRNSWLYDFVLDRKRHKQTFGVYPDIPIDDARQFAFDARKKVRENPEHEEIKPVRNLTVGDALDAYLPTLMDNDRYDDQSRRLETWVTTSAPGRVCFISND
jgi:hypothetical protein